MIHANNLKPGMKFCNIYGEHCDEIEAVDLERGMIRSVYPYHGYTGSFYWFAISAIYVLVDDFWHPVKEDR